MKTLLLIPSYAKTGVDAEIAADRHPTMDYQALAAGLRSLPGGQVELVDYAALDRETHPAVRLARKLAGDDAALAMMGFLRRDEFDTIFSNSESIALPLALLLKPLPRRPRHVTIAHRLSVKKKELLYRGLQLHRQMDVIFVYATSQLTFAESVLGIAPKSLRLVPFHADQRFFRPLATVAVSEGQICAAGLEWRDYPTLIEAVADESNLSVKLAAASPWSKHANEVQERVLPAHVDARRYDYCALRELYAQSSFVVVPLYENDFQAGITTILEAMAMGKPVVVTGTSGQTDAIVDEHNGLYVAPGSTQEWRRAIQRLRNDPQLRVRLGRNARRWLEENATLDRWVHEMMAGIYDTTAEAIRAQLPELPAVAPAAETRDLPADASGLQLVAAADDYPHSAEA